MSIATTTEEGAVRVSVDPTDPNHPIAVGDNDPRMLTEAEKTAMLGYDARITQNTTNISANAAAISNNTTSINNNSTNISTNAANISANAANISQNTTDIATNAANISQNTSDISTNATNISSNTSNISTNASNISQNSSDIATNAANISQNASDIATNAAAIATKADINHTHTFPITKTLYVDNGRTDSYTEDGSIDFPYKAVADAIAAATDGTLIKLCASQTSYGDVTLPAGTAIGLEGAGSSLTTIDNLTAPASNIISGLYIAGTAVSLGGTSKLYDVACANTVQFAIDGFVVLNNIRVIGATNTVLTVNANAEVILENCEFTATTDNNLVDMAGSYLKAYGSKLTVSGTGYALSATAGYVELYDTTIDNTTGLNAASLDNGATAATPNILDGVTTGKPINCAAKPTNVGTLFGSITGTALNFLSASYSNYDNSGSGLSATTVQAAIDEIDTQVDTNTTSIANKPDKGLSGSILFYAAASSGGATDQKHEITIVDGVITSYEINDVEQLS